MDLYTLPATGHRLVVARTRGERLLGLLPVRAMPPTDGLLLPRCRSVHTIGMAFALDLLWIGADGAVLRTDLDVGPFRQRTERRAAGVLETPAGAGPAWANALRRGGCEQALVAILAGVDCHEHHGAHRLTRPTLS